MGDNSIEGDHKGLPVQNGANAFWGKGAYTILGNGDNSIEGDHKGLPVQNGQMRFWGKGECDSPVQNGAYAISHTIGAWAICRGVWHTP